MSSTFVHGMLAEKARLAATLIAEVLSGVPDDVLWTHQAALSQGAVALQGVHDSLRTRTQEHAER